MNELSARQLLFGGGEATGAAAPCSRREILRVLALILLLNAVMCSASASRADEGKPPLPSAAPRAGCSQRRQELTSSVVAALAGDPCSASAAAAAARLSVKLVTAHMEEFEEGLQLAVTVRRGNAHVQMMAEGKGVLYSGCNVTAIQASRISSRCNRSASFSPQSTRAEELHLAIAMRRCDLRSCSMLTRCDSTMCMLQSRRVAQRYDVCAHRVSSICMFWQGRQQR